MDISRRYENTLVAILFFSWGTVFLDRTSQHYLAPYFAPEFHLSHQQIGMLGSVVAVTWALSTLFFGALSDRVGRKLILVPVVFIFSTLSWISGIVHSFHQLLLVRALLGIAEGPAWSSGWIVSCPAVGRASRRPQRAAIASTNPERHSGLG